VALSEYQRGICQLIAANRRANGESYVAGGVVYRDDESMLMQWARDSAFRFFPLVENDLLGLVLHPFDLATNKVLALAGRLEARDWIDVLNCHEYIQPLGYLVWAACGKDPGFSPTSLLAAARRSSRYSQIELDALAFTGTPPDARVLGAKWHVILQEAADICDLLPTAEVGKCVITIAGELYQGVADGLLIALENRSITFHAGTIRGVWPQVKGAGHEW
jgi:hypothetical protein